MVNRRLFLAGALAAVAMPMLSGAANAKPKRRIKRRVKRRVRRRIRRRIRRRVAWRLFGPRRRLIVPAALVVGWELMVDTRVVVVHEVRAGPTEIIVVRTVLAQGGDSGQVIAAEETPDEIEVHREDNDENTKEEQGSQLSDDDTSSPARETEEEVEVEVEEEVDE